MAKIQASVKFIKKTKVNNAGIHSKNNASNSKSSKNYLKSYRGQGR